MGLVSGDDPQVGLRSEDAFALAIRALQAGARHPRYAAADEDVGEFLDRLSDVEVRAVAGALALLPRFFAGAPLTDERELDRLALSFMWAWS